MEIVFLFGVNFTFRVQQYFMQVLNLILPVNYLSALPKNVRYYFPN